MSMNAWRTPQRVVAADCPDQIADLGRPAVPADIRDLIRTISHDKLWGAPRIHGELLKLGIDIAQSTVAKYISRRHGPRSPGWQAFLRNHTAHIAGIPRRSLLVGQPARPQSGEA